MRKLPVGKPCNLYIASLIQSKYMIGRYRENFSKLDKHLN